MKKIILTALKWLGVAVFWLLVWQLGAHILDKPLLLPSPAITAVTLARMASEGAMWLSVGASLARVVAGFAAGMVLGCLLGALTAASGLLRTLFRPLMTVVKSTPVASFIILALVLIPTAAVPSFTVVLIVMPVFWANIFEGALAVDRRLLEMAAVFRMNRRTKLLRIYAPSVEPYFVGAVETGIGLAWKSSIAAEVICVTGVSIGKGLYQSKIYLATEELFAWTAVVIALSLLLENLLVTLIALATKRRRTIIAAKEGSGDDKD